MAGELVLIVEDNDKNLELVQDILELRGFETLTATCGVEALALARAHQPALVLLDIQLPDVDGVEVMRRLRADPETAGIPVIALSAFAMSGDRARFLGAGFEDYVAKPIDIRVLPRLVQQHCRAVGSTDP
jgi:two-component system cell cycle response regulator DivK